MKTCLIHSETNDMSNQASENYLLGMFKVLGRCKSQILQFQQIQLSKSIQQTEFQVCQKVTSDKASIIVHVLNQLCY